MKKFLLTAILILSPLFLRATPVLADATEPFVGEIIAVPFDFAPKGWALCNGQILPIAQNTALFSLLGTTYGGDGKSTFALPNLEGRIQIGSGQGDGLALVDQGQIAGEERTTLLQNNLPSHSHEVAVQPKDQPINTVTVKDYQGQDLTTSYTALGTITASKSDGTTADSTAAVFAKSTLGPNHVKAYYKPSSSIDLTLSDAAAAAQVANNGLTAMDENGMHFTNVTALPTGGGQPFNNMQPYLTMHYIIALQGVFPPRQ
jgi:microcystin-dependent protein